MASDFLELVKKRYSARDYLYKPVERGKIEKCLESARLAPSACNSQPWKFIIIEDPEQKNKVCDKIFTGAYRMNQFVKKAPVLVVVVSLKGSFITKVGNLLRDTRYYLIDVGIAVEHFCLQAAELGLGTCWIGWFNEKALKKALNIPKKTRVDVVLSLGYPAGEAPEKKRKAMEEMAEYNPESRILN